jgi:hydroxypyruvate isomerase
LKAIGEADSMAQIALNLGMVFAERPLLERFGAAAAAGFKAVELQFPYGEAPSAVRAELDRHRLTILGLNTAPGRPGESGLGAVPGREQDFALLFRQALEYAEAIGARTVHCMAGLVPAEQRPAAERVFSENLARAADLAAEKGIGLLIEPLNPRERPGYFLSRVEHGAEIIDRLARPNIRLQFDFYHVQITSGDLLKRFEKHLPVIGHVQIAAVPSRAEPDEGEVNFPAVIDAIDRLGYRGWVAAEYKPRGRTEDGLVWARRYGIVPVGG